MNNDLVQNIVDIFGNKQYNIPDYQRGYEWRDNDVYLLLNDLKKFSRQLSGKYEDSKDKFYSLQHITILKKGMNGNMPYYNIVDGQQRLTTMAIILSYFGKGDLVKNKFKYSTRKDTGSFLNNEILTRNYWNGGNHSNSKHKDEFYIRMVADTVRAWDEEQAWENTEERKIFIESILLDKIKMIINEVDGNEEQIFANINGAKAELDGGDLMRAILITHSSKEKYKSTKIIDENSVNEFRMKMGMELDCINNWCGQEDAQEFLGQFLSRNSFDKSGFDEKTYPIDNLYRMMYEIHPQKDQSFNFRYFEYGLDIKGNGIEDDNWEMYEELKRIYGFMHDWFDNNEIYHYISYLFSNFKSKITYVEIHKEWSNSKNKDLFKEYLKKKISEFLLESYSKENAKQDLINELRNLSEDWYSNVHLKKILVLQDIIACCDSSRLRLPIRLFSVSTQEDIEHIGCQTPNEDDLCNKEKWLAYIKALSNQYKFGIDEKVLNEWRKKLEEDNRFDEATTKEIAISLNKYGLCSIGNLVLLHQRRNRSYKNASFNKKKSLIINDFYTNKYDIRPYTLKTFASNITSEWTLEDIKTMANNIADNVERFLILS